jgi:hypothetical protein
MQPSTPFPTLPARPAQPPVSLVVWVIRVALASAFMLVVLRRPWRSPPLFGMRYRDVIYPGVSAWGLDLWDDSG